MKIKVILLGTVLATAVAASGAPAAEGPVKIGVDTPLSGTYAARSLRHKSHRARHRH